MDCLGVVCDFTISWSEAAGVLTSVGISLDFENDNFGSMHNRFGLTGGPLASDGTDDRWLWQHAVHG